MIHSAQKLCFTRLFDPNKISLTKFPISSSTSELYIVLVIRSAFKRFIFQNHLKIFKSHLTIFIFHTKETPVFFFKYSIYHDDIVHTPESSLMKLVSQLLLVLSLVLLLVLIQLFLETQITLLVTRVYSFTLLRVGLKSEIYYSEYLNLQTHAIQCSVCVGS